MGLLKGPLCSVADPLCELANKPIEAQVPYRPLSTSPYLPMSGSVIRSKIRRSCPELRVTAQSGVSGTHDETWVY